MVIGGIAGIMTSWNAFLVGASRAVYALARAGMLPGWLGHLHPRFNTPYAAILLIGSFACISPLFGRQILIWLINAGGLAVIIAYGMVAVSFLVLRRREPDMPRPFRVAKGTVTGVAALVLSILLLLLYLPGSPAALTWPYEWLICLGWVALGAGFFVWARVSSH
jgi:amino acid transporter